MSIKDNTFKVTVAGEELNVRYLCPEGNDNARTTLVLLHEALGSVIQWRDFPEVLLDITGLPVLLYDRCGFGESQSLTEPRGLDYFEREVSSLELLLRACEVDKPILLGHSDGATIALLFAATYPERISAVISEAAHLYVEDETINGITEVVKRWETTDMRQKLERYHGKKAENVFRAWADTWLNPLFRDWTIEARMPEVTCPVLAIQGVDDEFGTEQQLQTISSRISGPCRSSVINACGHIPHHQARAAVLDEITAFLGDVHNAA